jgi:hypothetical protein
MWVLKYLMCLVRSHVFAAISSGNLPYRYCLRCGKIELQDAVTSRDVEEAVLAANPGRTE